MKISYTIEIHPATPPTPSIEVPCSDPFERRKSVKTKRLVGQVKISVQSILSSKTSRYKVGLKLKIFDLGDRGRVVHPGVLYTVRLYLIPEVIKIHSYLSTIFCDLLLYFLSVLGCCREL